MSRGIARIAFSISSDRIGVFAGELFVLAVKLNVLESLAQAWSTICN
jgi:hypothetical protein